MILYMNDSQVKKG